MIDSGEEVVPIPPVSVNDTIIGWLGKVRSWIGGYAADLAPLVDRSLDGLVPIEEVLTALVLW